MTHHEMVYDILLGYGKYFVILKDRATVSVYGYMQNNW